MKCLASYAYMRKLNHQTYNLIRFVADNIIMTCQSKMVWRHFVFAVSFLTEDTRVYSMWKTIVCVWYDSCTRLLSFHVNCLGALLMSALTIIERPLLDEYKADEPMSSLDTWMTETAIHVSRALIGKFTLIHWMAQAAIKSCHIFYLLWFNTFYWLNEFKC